MPQVLTTTRLGTNEIAVILFFCYCPYHQKKKKRFIHLLALPWPASLSYRVKVCAQLSVLCVPVSSLTSLTKPTPTLQSCRNHGTTNWME